VAVLPKSLRTPLTKFIDYAKEFTEEDLLIRVIGGTTVATSVPILSGLSPQDPDLRLKIQDVYRSNQDEVVLIAEARVRSKAETDTFHGRMARLDMRGHFFRLKKDGPGRDPKHP